MPERARARNAASGETVSIGVLLCGELALAAGTYVQSRGLLDGSGGSSEILDSMTGVAGAFGGRLDDEQRTEMSKVMSHIAMVSVSPL